VRPTLEAEPVPEHGKRARLKEPSEAELEEKMAAALHLREEEEGAVVEVEA